MKVRLPILVGVVFLSLTMVADAGGDNAKKLIGSWEMTEKGSTTTLQFTKDGKLKVQVKLGDKVFDVAGTYTVKGDKISVKLEFMGKVKEDSAKIKKLDAKVLQLEKEDGKVEEFKRKTKAKK